MDYLLFDRLSREPGCLKFDYIKTVPVLGKAYPGRGKEDEKLRLLEIYDVNLEPLLQELFLDRIKDPRYGLCLVEEDQIKNFRSENIKYQIGIDDEGLPIYTDAQIGENALALLNDTFLLPKSDLK